MVRMLRWAAVGVPLVLVFSLASFAQDGVLEELYGRGVHAYFAHQYQEAHGLLSDAIAQGSQDPRTYYFRAMCLSRLGREDDAKLDYADGARLEVANGDIFPIGRSLERVQGADRMMLESFRKQARLDARRTQLNQDRARYQNTRASDAGNLQNPAASGAPPVAPAGAVDSTDPFGGNPAAAPMPAPAPAPAPGPAPADPNDPFGAPAAPATPAPAPAAPAPAPAPAPADPNDPFGAPAAPATPAPAAPAPAPAPADPNDPFGAPAAPAPAPAPAANDPFGAAPAPAAPVAGKSGGTINSLLKAFSGALPTAKPVAPAMPADQGNPFQDDPVVPGAAPVPGAPAPAAPAVDPNDPFGAAPAPAAPAPAPAAPPPAPAAVDPFGS